MAVSETARGLITSVLRRVHNQLDSERGGAVADYIPELASADPEPFGLALCSVNGTVYSAGEATQEFTIQSVSKPLVYALALTDIGLDAVHERVGAEPSGEAFNAVKLEAGTGRPPNPMVNAGAILTTSLVAGDSLEDRFERILDWLSRFAGRRLSFDEQVFRSESATGDRNRALAYLMRSAGSLTADVTETVELYFRQCSILVTAEDLAVMGATLGNHGVNPLTGEQVLSESNCEHVLTIMATCGMYDYAGEWLLRAGLPAKSGVAGGLVATSLGEFGVGLFSSRLDHNGNSVRAVAAAQELAALFGLHILNRPKELGWRSCVVEPAHLRDAPASEGAELAALLDEHRSALLMWRFRGYVDFASTEGLYVAVDNWRDSLAASSVSEASDSAAQTSQASQVSQPSRAAASAPQPTIILDFSGVTQVQSVAVDMIAVFVLWAESQGIHVAANDPSGQGKAIAGLARHSALADTVRSAIAAQSGKAILNN
ncbi:MAG: glutaminase A [Mycetocola sp.]